MSRGLGAKLSLLMTVDSTPEATKISAREIRHDRKTNEQNSPPNVTFKKKKKRMKKKSMLSSSPKGKKSTLMPLKELKLGSKIDGIVAGFTEFGIFIRTNIDMKGKGSNGYALLHKSQIRDEPVDDLAKLFRIGAVLKDLRVININYAKGEVGLSLRKQRKKRKKFADITLGVDMEATVSKVVPYGAFLDFGYDRNALIHVSRISQKKIGNVRQWLNEGDKVVAHIIKKDTVKGTLAASMLDTEADRFLDRRSFHMKEIKKRCQMNIKLISSNH